MIVLTTNEIIKLHSKVVLKTCGIDGFKSMDLLDSAVNQPLQTFGGQDLYPTIIDKAACLCYGLISNHPFLDGNKRTGVVAMILLLSSNRININYTQDELIKLGLNVATGLCNMICIKEWIITHLT